MKKLVIFLFALIILICNVSASDITISTSRNSYNAEETVQAEIFLGINPTQELTVTNFELLKENNDKIQLTIYSEKLSNSHYFIYFNIQENIEKGNYKLKVKNVNYISNGILNQISQEKQIYIDTVNSGFYYLTQQQNQDGSFSDIQTTTLVALALKNTYPTNAQQAINYLVQNQDVNGCYPKNNCNIKDTSFALLALNSFNQNIIKTKNWLKDASNNFNLGTWSLIINSQNSVCNFNGQNITITQQQTYPLTSNEINITCTNQVTLTLNHFYLGTTHQIFSETASNKYYKIEDSGCYGLYYKSACNYESTGYATWTLKQLGENPSITYLQQNPLDNQTLDHALLYLIDGNQYSFDWLLNNLQNDYWSSQSAYLNQNPNNYVSAFAAYGLKNNMIYQNVKSYLSQQTTNNQLNSALILYLLFNDETLKPAISVNPGIVNKKNLFDLTLTNDQDPIQVQIISPEFISLPASLLLTGSQTFTLNIPNTPNFNIEILYSNLSYIIPILTSYENVTTTTLLPPPQDSIAILNFPTIVNTTLNFDDKTQDILQFQNTWGFPLYNISFILIGDLNEIINLEQNTFDVIEPNQTLEQTITINENRNPKKEEYSGYLIITSQQNTISSLNFNIYFTLKETPPEVPQNEEIENETQEETPQTNNTNMIIIKKENKKSYWLLIFPVIFFVIGILVFFLKGKKIKTQTFDQYIKNIKK